jgi:hypothetical protein
MGLFLRGPLSYGALGLFEIRSLGGGFCIFVKLGVLGKPLNFLSFRLKVEEEEGRVWCFF